MPAFVGERRLAKIRISSESIPVLFQKGAIIKVSRNGLPKDARVVGVYADPETHTVQFMLESESFSPIPQYGKVPNLEDIVFERVDG